MFLCSHCLCEVVNNLMVDLDISLFMLNMCNTMKDILIVVMSPLSFRVFTHACHCKVQLFAGVR